jgi:hypothetical protein
LFDETGSDIFRCLLDIFVVKVDIGWSYLGTVEQAVYDNGSSRQKTWTTGIAREKRFPNPR